MQHGRRDPFPFIFHSSVLVGQVWTWHLDERCGCILARKLRILDQNQRGAFLFRANERVNSRVLLHLEPIVQLEETILRPVESARGQGAVVQPAPPSMWIYRLGDKFSCRTMVSYPTPLNNVQHHISPRESATKPTQHQKRNVKKALPATISSVYRC